MRSFGFRVSGVRCICNPADAVSEKYGPREGSFQERPQIDKLCLSMGVISYRNTCSLSTQLKEFYHTERYSLVILVAIICADPNRRIRNWKGNH